MNRSIKNIIMIVIVILMGVAMYLTINMKTSSNNGMSAPPDMPSGENNGTPPAKPGENSESNSTGDMIGNPPARPDESSDGSTSTPPDMPSNGNGGTPPEKPDGDMTPPDMQGSSSDNTLMYILLGVESLVASSLLVYLIMSGFNKKSFKETYQDKNKLVITGLLVIILTAGMTYLGSTLGGSSSNNNGGQGGPNSNPNNGGNGGTATYSASKEITKDEDITEGTYNSSTKDENVISVSGSIKTSLSNITVTKTGESDGGDNTSFYGTNSAIIAKDGATVNITNAQITTDATGANGVFSYGGSATTNNSKSDGTTVNISNSTITTSKDNSGGIMTTGGGTMNATNLTITTAGTSSAAIRSDRGGGIVTVSEGTYKTTGKGSPAIYSTADITVKNATLVSTASEGAIIEGKNSITLENVDLIDTNNELNGQSTTYKNIFLYQSMSGDAADGEAVFTSKNSKITTNKGDSFYITNTTATINLENNEITNIDSTGYFLRAQKDSWGNSGSNGGNVTLNLTNQKVNGNIYIDNISSLSINMVSSNYEGTINKDNIAKSISIKLDSSSILKLTGDSYITSLEDSDSTYSNIDLNGYKLYVNGKELTK